MVCNVTSKDTFKISQVDLYSSPIIYLVMGQMRSKAETTKVTQLTDNHRFEAVATGMCGWRLYMEDSHICQLDLGDGNSIFAVFDGHGGPEVADLVARTMVSLLTSNKNYQEKNYDQALIDVFMSYDRRMKTPEGIAEIKSIRQENQAKKNASTEEVSQAGCTAVACLVTQNELIVANVGDSRCFVGIDKKHAEDMSIDHKPEIPQEAERIKAAGGEITEGRVNGNLNLSRAIGDLQYKINTSLAEDKQLIISRPQIKKRSMQGVTHIVLGCDGIFDWNSNQDIYNMILEGEPNGIKQAAEHILQELVADDTEGDFGLDNMTLIVIKVKGK